LFIEKAIHQRVITPPIISTSQPNQTMHIKPPTGQPNDAHQTAGNLYRKTPTKRCTSNRRPANQTMHIKPPIIFTGKRQPNDAHQTAGNLYR
jgi:hypothetical protein